MGPDFGADIVLELRRPAPGDRCRELLGHAGFAQTPSRMRFEFNADGTDASVLPDPLPVLPRFWPRLLRILGSASGPLTRAEIHALLAGRPGAS